MVINCQVCGRPVCEITPPEISSVELGVVRRILSGFSIDAGKLDMIVNPSPEVVTREFKVQCPRPCDPRGQVNGHG